MIEINEKHTEIAGTNLDILVDVLNLFDKLLKISPEIINAVVAGYTKELSKSIETCNPAILRSLIEIVEEYNEKKSEQR